MPGKARSKKTFMRQKMMTRVVTALVPCLIGGVYFFGWRSAVMVGWVLLWGCLTEWFMARRRGDPLTESCLVTCFLFALSLPPHLPFWMATVGIVVGIFFGKEVFGGFGRNVFNPAVVGRAFVYVCFPIEMTSQFCPVWRGGLAGFTHWGPNKMIEGLSALTAATPMWSRRDFGVEANLADLATGTIGQAFSASDGVQRAMAAGSVGEVSAVLILIGGAYLLWTKTASWRLVASSLGGAAVAVVMFRHVLGADGVPPVPWTLCSGAMLYACFFMVTDPVSAPRDQLAQFIYGAFIGFMIVFLRWKAVFAGGVAFAILLGNTVGPSIEMWCKAYAKKRKAAKATPKPSTA